MPTLYEQVRARLIEGISAGRWKPGEALPSESELASSHRVAIGTIRKAVDSLVAEGALLRHQGKGTFVTAHDGGRLMFHFFHIVGRDGTRSYPEVRTLSFRRDRADATAARALGIAQSEKVIRIRNVLSLEGRACIVDDITLPATLFPGLTEKIFLARDNTIYHLYQSRYGINVLRTDERLRAILATAEDARLLGLAAGAPLLEIRRVALTFRDRPVELRVSRVDTTGHAYHNTFGKGFAALSTALLILPNFVLILVGLALARAFDYGRDFWDGLEKLVYYVLFPALLFRSLAIARIDLAQAGALVAAACAFTIAGFVLSLAAGPLFKLDRQLHATGSQCGYRFNTYIGLAVAGSLFGTQGVALAALLLGVMIPLANLGAVAVLAAHSDRGFLSELARHPLVLSSLAGFAWNLSGLPLPGFADQTLALLGQTALPAGLLSVGAAMRLERGQGPIGAHAWWLAVKLAVVPAIALGLARWVGASGMEAAVLVLCAALPTATNAYILAVRMTGDGRAVATQVTVGTIFSMATLPTWMALV